MNTTKKAKRNLAALRDRSCNRTAHPDYWKPAPPVLSISSNGCLSYHASHKSAQFYVENIPSCANRYD
jgi:hypothetical protein